MMRLFSTEKEETFTLSFISLKTVPPMVLHVPFQLWHSSLVTNDHQDIMFWNCIYFSLQDGIEVFNIFVTVRRCWCILV